MTLDEAVDSIGMIATGGILARAVDGVHADAPGEHGGTCANCGARLTGKFCAECGQHGHVHRTIGALFHDILHGVFHFEGRVWHTLPMLALRPGELTRRYARGERARFVSPMALFLFSVFLMFAASGSLINHIDFGKAATPRTAEVMPAEYQQQLGRLARSEKRIAKIDARAAKGQADGDDPADRADAIAAGVSARAELAKLDGAAKALGIDLRAKAKPGKAADESFQEKLNHAKDNPALMVYKVKTYAYKYSWALIPISLPFIWLLFPLRRDVGMYDHAIFATYSLSFMMLFTAMLAALSMIGVTQWVLWTALGLIPPVHMYRQLMGAYELGRLSAIWRTSWLLIMVTITASLFFALLMYLGASD